MSNAFVRSREWLRWVAVAAALVGLCHVDLRYLGAEEAKQIPTFPPGVHQLFLDDAMIERMDHFQRTVNPVVKHRDNPLVVPEKPWEGGTLFLDNAVVYDEAARLFKMYCLVPSFATGQARRTSYLTSPDGIRWERPKLGLVEHEGSTENNILPVHVSHVVYDPRPNEPAARAFKGIGYGLADAAPRSDPHPGPRRYPGGAAGAVHPVARPVQPGQCAGSDRPRGRRRRESRCDRARTRKLAWRPRPPRGRHGTRRRRTRRAGRLRTYA